MTTKLLVKKIAQDIQRSKPDEQRKLLAQLPHLLRLEPSDFALLKLSEDSFDFWNNLDDIIYDDL